MKMLRYLWYIYSGSEDSTIKIVNPPRQKGANSFFAYQKNYNFRQILGFCKTFLKRKSFNTIKVDQP